MSSMSPSTWAPTFSAEGIPRTSSADASVPVSQPATPAMMWSSVAGYSGPVIVRPYFSW